MFSGMKMKEFMESERSSIFRAELATKYVVHGSSGTHFMHMRVNKPKNNFILFLIIKYWRILRMSPFLIDLWPKEKSYTVPFHSVHLL